MTCTQAWTGLRNCSEWLSFVMKDRSYQIVFAQETASDIDSIPQCVPHTDPGREWRVDGLAMG